MQEFFGPGGVLEQRLEDYEFRPSQVRMAEAVQREIVALFSINSGLVTGDGDRRSCRTRLGGRRFGTLVTSGRPPGTVCRLEVQGLRPLFFDLGTAEGARIGHRYRQSPPVF